MDLNGPLSWVSWVTNVEPISWATNTHNYQETIGVDVNG
jgi:hypothetical protein